MANLGTITLHGFCDASQAAYSTCIYIRNQFHDGSITVNLLMSKCRVALMRTTSIPRLELCDALLLSELIVEIQAELSTINVKFKSSGIVLWTDSSVVLEWIQSVVQLKSFVANRISYILENTEAIMCRHSPTASNPEDLITRGTNARTLADPNHIWWNGPSWLVVTKNSWPAEIPLQEDLPEVRPIKLSLLATHVDVNWIIDRCSNWLKLMRVTGYVLRFVFNCYQDVTNKLFNQKI